VAPIKVHVSNELLIVRYYTSNYVRCVLMLEPTHGRTILHANKRTEIRFVDDCHNAVMTVDTDYTLRVWTAVSESAACARTFVGHTHIVYGTATDGNTYVCVCMRADTHFTDW
jgi:hypothetical protein